MAVVASTSTTAMPRTVRTSHRSGLCLLPCLCCYAPDASDVRSTTGRASALRRQRHRRRRRLRSAWAVGVAESDRWLVLPHLARGSQLTRPRRQFASRARNSLYAGEHGTARERGGHSRRTCPAGRSKQRGEADEMERRGRRPSGSTASPLD